MVKGRHHSGRLSASTALPRVSVTMAADSTSQLQSIIERMAGGDAAARDELISRAYRRLHRLAHKMLENFPRLRPFEDTDDLLHDSLPRLARALQSVPPDSVSEFFGLACRQMRWELLDLVERNWPAGQRPQGPAVASPGGFRRQQGIRRAPPALIIQWCWRSGPSFTRRSNCCPKCSARLSS